MLLSTNNDAVGVYSMSTERSDLFVVVCAIQELNASPLSEQYD